MNEPKVGIVVVHFGPPEKTERCLGSLADLEFDRLLVFVVDNDPQNRLSKNLGGTTPTAVIESDRNRGFAAGANRGIREALKRGCDYVLLVNDDIEVDPRLLRSLWEPFRRDAAIGITGPIITYTSLFIRSSAFTRDPIADPSTTLGAGRGKSATSKKVRSSDFSRDSIAGKPATSLFIRSSKFTCDEERASALTRDRGIANKFATSKKVRSSDFSRDSIAGKPATSLFIRSSKFTCDPTARIWFAGGDFNRTFCFTRHPGMGKTLDQAPPSRRVNFITGCCLLIKREVFEKIGLLDEDYFLYFEDLDFGVRAKKAGFENFLVAEPLVEHDTGDKFSPQKAYYFARNPFIFIKKNTAGFTMVTSLLGQFLVRLPYYLQLFIRRRNFGALRAYLVGLKSGLQLLGRRSRTPAR